jgi:hypothetical protein
VRHPLPRVAALAALAAAAGLSALPAADAPARGADKDGVTVETVEYKGWKNNVRISNGDAELIVTLDVGPRVISYRLKDGKNVFKEFTDQLGKSGEKTWQIRGGHRFWIAPEDVTRTYFPDNIPVKYKQFQDNPKQYAVRFTEDPEKEHGVQKEIDLDLAPGGSKVKVTHRLKNTGDKPLELALWAPTVMAPGGVEVLPLPPHKPHPGPVKPEAKPADYAPNQLISVWPYFDFTDKRWTFGGKYITLRQDKTKGPTKLGFAHRLGWVGYLNDKTLFVKRFDYKEGETYVDNGVNYETFSNEEFLEMESMGPLIKLAPGAVAEHVETWELVGGVDDFSDEAGIDKNVLPKVGGK